MGRVLVVTDSSTCLPDGLVKALDIRVLPISMHLPDGSVDVGSDGNEESPSWRLPEEVERDELAGADRPFVTEYLSAAEEPGYEAAVIVTPAIEFAAMYRNAALAAELASRSTVTVDSRTAAAGQALVVLAGAEAAHGGASLEEVAEAVREASRRVELVASLATLEPIRKSGPIPEEILQVSELSGTRSVFRMRGGTVEPLGGVATTDEALVTIRDAFAGSAGGVVRAAVFHADVPELARRLERLLGGVDLVTGFSIAMQVHTGRGVVGAAWLPKLPE